MEDKILNLRKNIKKISVDSQDLIENIVFEKKENYLDFNFGVDIICAYNSIHTVKYFIGDFKPFLEKNYSIFPIQFQKTSTPIDKMLNPYDSKNCSIGVNNKENANYWAEICLKVGYLNSIIVSGYDSFPYYTPFEESYIAEAWKNKIFTISINPKLLGFKEYDINSIKCENIEENFEILKAIFQNKINDAPYQTLVVNSALSLYITKKAKSITDAVDLAKKTINNNNCFELFNKLQTYINSNKNYLL